VVRENNTWEYSPLEVKVLEGLGKHRELPTGVQGRAPAGNVFWHILRATERSFLHLYAMGSSNSVSCHIWGKIVVWREAIAPCPNIEPWLSLGMMYQGIKNDNEDNNITYISACILTTDTELNYMSLISK